MLALLLAVAAPADWTPAPAPLMTKWGKQVTPENAWPEYPRPHLVRQDWQTLNGLWEYCITPRTAARPTAWDGKILVPFAAESALSGVGKHPTAEQALWYRRQVTVPAGWAGKRVLLHFGAVDWEATVWVNGTELTTHRGGSDPFSVDITDALKGGSGELVVRVWDPTDAGSQPRGKQVTKPRGIWYTAVTGIWQTVWMEPVPATHITRVVFTPDIDTGAVECLVENVGGADALLVEVQTNPPVTLGTTSGARQRLKLPNPRLWSPDSPHLYPVVVRALVNGRAVDTVETYFAFRKTSVGVVDGVMRLLLNNKPVFQFGPLDQGWWPDGLLTPPSDAAMRYDVEVLKALGFNMLRKHIKVEPARFYRHCDELGMLVWQDMPSGMIGTDNGGERGRHHVLPGGKEDAKFTPDEAAVYRRELKAMIDHLRGFGCIVAWVPFNEGWGQHDTNATLRWVKQYDPSRPVNGPSG
jgi:beta-galactosidase/beta-glucuronidase